MSGRNAYSVVLLFLLLAGNPLFAQRIKKMDFRNQPIVDILMVLSDATGASIVPDETVAGNASFFFAESEFEDALRLFLSVYKLHYVKTANTYYISRIRSSYDRGKDAATLVADEVDLQVLIRHFSKIIGKTILYDSLPRSTLSIHAEGVLSASVLEMLMKRFPEFRIEAYADYYFLRRIPTGAQAGAGTAGERAKISREGDFFSLELDKGRFQEALADLFKAAGREYSLLGRIDAQLENLRFGNRDFDGLLRLLLEQGNADFVVSQGVYYIFEIQRKDILKKFRHSIILPLKHISAQDLVNLLPADIASGNLLKVDRGSNSVILTGSGEEIDPVLSFLGELDRPTSGLEHQRFDIKFLKAKDVVALVPAKLMPIAPSLVPESNSFIALLPEGGRAALDAFISMIDRKVEGVPVRLRYMKVEDFLKALPPSVSKEDLVDGGYPNLVFFVGSEEKRRLFLREIELIDRPKPQIRYELMVVQYQKSNSIEWSKDLKTSSINDGSKASFVGSMSSLLNLSFDAVSVFGYQTALQFNLELTESRARVFADTTLTGISGQEVKFQNTDTFRYREKEWDEDTETTKYTGVTSSITTGLIIGINGWVSGDGMVTMTVNATVSKQGEDESTTTGNPPPTSEKIVSTNVRTASGRPVVIGGLLQQNKSTSVSKVPFLGDIPLLGLLFRDIKESIEDTETVIYVVPHVTFGDEGDGRVAGRKIESYYNSFVKDFVR